MEGNTTLMKRTKLPIEVDYIGYGYNLPEKGVAVSPFRYYYWMLFVMTNNFCCGTPIRNGLPVEKKTKMYFRYI